MMDPLERLMAKFDITGQSAPMQHAPPHVAQESSAHSLQGSARAPDRPDADAARCGGPATNLSRTQSLSGRGARHRMPSHRDQLKHALKLNAAHVITHDYLTLSQPLSEGMLLMDR
jgi:hypothetical protein